MQPVQPLVYRQTHHRLSWAWWPSSGLQTSQLFMRYIKKEEKEGEDTCLGAVLVSQVLVINLIVSPAARKFVIHWQMGADTVSLEWRTSGMMLFSAKLFQFYGEAKLHFWWCHVIIYTDKIHKHKLYKTTYLTATHQPDIMSSHTWIAVNHRERVKPYLRHLPPKCCP